MRESMDTKRAKKGVVRKSQRKVELPPLSDESFRDSPISADTEGRKKRNTRAIIVGVLLVGLIVLFFFNRGIFIAAIVDGKPIFRWQLNRTMSSRYGQQTLEGMIGETLIADQALREGIVVTQQEVDEKVGEIVAGLGENIDINRLLELQGMTRSEFENQVRLQLTVERVLTKDLSITEADIAQFEATNAGRFTASDAATMRTQVRQAIVDEYVSNHFQTWFTALKDKASIVRYL
jgi:hypothetical protein